MSAEDRLKQMIGGLAFQVASLEAENEALRAERDAATAAVSDLTQRLAVAMAGEDAATPPSPHSSE